MIGCFEFPLRRAPLSGDFSGELQGLQSLPKTGGAKYSKRIGEFQGWEIVGVITCENQTTRLYLNALGNRGNMPQGNDIRANQMKPRGV